MTFFSRMKYLLFTFSWRCFHLYKEIPLPVLTTLFYLQYILIHKLTVRCLYRRLIHTKKFHCPFFPLFSIYNTNWYKNKPPDVFTVDYSVQKITLPVLTYLLYLQYILIHKLNVRCLYHRLIQTKKYHCPFFPLFSIYNTN